MDQEIQKLVATLPHGASVRVMPLDIPLECFVQTQTVSMKCKTGYPECHGLQGNDLAQRAPRLGLGYCFALPYVFVAPEACSICKHVDGTTWKYIERCGAPTQGKLPFFREPRANNFV